MILSELDLFILQQIHEGDLRKKDVTTWTIAKKYNWGEELNNKGKSSYDGKCVTVGNRCKKMAKEGLIIIEREDRKNNYIIDGSRVKYQRKHKIGNATFPAIAVLDKLKKWTIFQI